MYTKEEMLAEEMDKRMYYLHKYEELEIDGKLYARARIRFPCRRPVDIGRQIEPGKDITADIVKLLDRYIKGGGLL